MIKNITWTIDLPMEFPDDWNYEDILFKLNESSWCCSNLISLLEKYHKSVGCLCGIARAEISE